MFRIRARKGDIKLGVVSIAMKLYGYILNYVTKRCGVKRKKVEDQEQNLGVHHEEAEMQWNNLVQ